jgi:hypothetical protein
MLKQSASGHRAWSVTPRVKQLLTMISPGPKGLGTGVTVMSNEIGTFFLIYHTHMRMPVLGSGTPYPILEILLMVGVVGLIGCAVSQPIEPKPTGKALLGKSKQELVACAGKPLEETKTAEGTVLSYYKQAPMFEESYSLSKGSTSGAHHGCWAHLLMEDNLVVGIEYRSVPRSVDSTDHCEEIFHTCVQ